MLVLLTNFLKQLCVLLCCLYCVVFCYLFENCIIHFYSYSLQSFYFLTLPINTYCESIHFRLKKKSKQQILKGRGGPRWGQRDGARVELWRGRWSSISLLPAWLRLGQAEDRHLQFHRSSYIGCGVWDFSAVHYYPGVSADGYLQVMGAVRTHWHLHGVLAD